ncbi:MAG: hypothetical protein Q8S57_02775 [Methanoregula sp.]|nr:hypothetical protein [Methanoregula sp.]
MPESQHFFYWNFLDITGISLHASGEPGKGTRFLDGDAKRDVPVLKMNEKNGFLEAGILGGQRVKKLK